MTEAIKKSPLKFLRESLKMTFLTVVLSCLCPGQHGDYGNI